MWRNGAFVLLTHFGALRERTDTYNIEIYIGGRTSVRINWVATGDSAANALKRWIFHLVMQTWTMDLDMNRNWRFGRATRPYAVRCFVHCTSTRVEWNESGLIWWCRIWTLSSSLSLEHTNELHSLSRNTSRAHVLQRPRELSLPVHFLCSRLNDRHENWLSEIVGVHAAHGTTWYAFCISVRMKLCKCTLKCQSLVPDAHMAQLRKLAFGKLNWMMLQQHRKKLETTAFVCLVSYMCSSDVTITSSFCLYATSFTECAR